MLNSPKMMSHVLIVAASILACDRPQVERSKFDEYSSIGSGVEADAEADAEAPMIDLSQDNGDQETVESSSVEEPIENQEVAAPLEVAVDEPSGSQAENVTKASRYIEPQAIDPNVDAHTRTLFRWPENIAELNVGESLSGQIKLSLDLRNHCIIDDLRSTSVGIAERNWLRYANCDPEFRTEAFKKASNMLTIKKIDQIFFKVLNLDGNCAQKNKGGASFFMTFEPCDETNPDQLLDFMVDQNNPEFGKIKVNSESTSCLFAETDSSSANDINADPEAQRLLISNIQVSNCNP